MPLRKINDLLLPCLHPDHNPPNNIVLPPGEYEHICPACHKVTVFFVHGIICSTSDNSLTASPTIP